MISVLASLALLSPLPQEPDGALFSEANPGALAAQDPAGEEPRLQDAAGEAPGEPIEFEPLREPLFGEHADGTWVRTKTYKARFAPSGMTFVPFLGAQAERNHPLELRLASATVGEQPLSLPRRGEVRRAGDWMTIDRGPVDVVYDVRQDGLEQIFRFDGALPEGGPLRLSLDVHTDLVGRPDDGTFLFEGPEGGVRYGAAVAIDGEGRRLALHSELQGAQILIEVPEWFVSRAGGDLIVDPLLSTWINHATPGVDGVNPDIAYDRTDDVYCTVYELRFSGSDSDVLGTVTGQMGTVVDLITIDTSAADIRRPQVAGLGATDQFLVVAERFDGPGGRHEIVGRIHNLQTRLTGPLLLIAGTGLFTTWTNARPDVGGNSSTAAGTMFAVVYERQFLTGSLAGSTAGRVAMVLPDGSVDTTRVIETEAGAALTEFAISKSASDPATVNRWNVAYIRNRPGEPAQIRGVQLNTDGTMANAPNRLQEFITTDLPSSVDVSDGLPVSAGVSRYLVVYDRPNLIGGGVNVILCQNNVRRDGFPLWQKDGGSGQRRRQGAGVTITYEEYIVAYHEQQADGSWRTRATNLDTTLGDSLAAAEARVSLSPPYTEPAGKVAIASRATGGVFSRWAGVTSSGAQLPTSDNRVRSVLFEASSPYSPAPQYCGATINSSGEVGYLRFFGNQSTTSTKTVTATDLPPLQFSMLVVGTGQDFVSGFAGGQGNLCVGGTFGRYTGQIQPISGGGSISFSVDPSQIPIGGSLVAASPGDSYFFQVWFRDALPGGAQTTNLSNAARFRFN